VDHLLHVLKRLGQPVVKNEYVLTRHTHRR
jgi:hypothetical protein